MRDLIRARRAQGTPTLDLEHGLSFPERFRGRPSGAPIGVDDKGRAVLDLATCLFSPEEAGGEVTYTHDCRLSSNTRDGLTVIGDVPPRVTALDQRMRKLFGRSLRLRSVV